MKNSNTMTKVALVVLAAFVLSGCYQPSDANDNYQTFGTQPYPTDDYNPAGNAH